MWLRLLLMQIKIAVIKRTWMRSRGVGEAGRGKARTLPFWESGWTLLAPEVRRCSDGCTSLP